MLPYMLIPLSVLRLIAALSAPDPHHDRNAAERYTNVNNIVNSANTCVVSLDVPLQVLSVLFHRKPCKISHYEVTRLGFLGKVFQ